MMKLFYPLFLLTALAVVLKDFLTFHQPFLSQRETREISRRLDAIRES